MTPTPERWQSSKAFCVKSDTCLLIDGQVREPWEVHPASSAGQAQREDLLFTCTGCGAPLRNLKVLEELNVTNNAE